MGTKPAKPVKHFALDQENLIRVYATYDEASAIAKDGGIYFQTQDSLYRQLGDLGTDRVFDVVNSLQIPSYTREAFDTLKRIDVAEIIYKEVNKLKPPAPVVEKSSAKPAKAAKPKKEPKPKAAKKEKVKKAPKAKKEPKPKKVKQPKAPKVKKERAPKVPREPGAPRQPGSSVTPSEKPPREGSKGDKIIKLMLRDNGATLNEIAKVLDQEMHTEKTKKDPLATSRGYLSGLRQRFAKFYTITSEKEEGGKVRRYKAVEVK